MLTCELRDKWVKALRSGEYKQGTKHLREGDTFCCLGVLCEVAEIPIALKGSTRVYNEEVEAWLEVPLYAYFVPNNGEGSDPDAGWTDAAYPIDIAGLDANWCRTFAELNDNGATFESIAKDIEDLVPCEIEEQK